MSFAASYREDTSIRVALGGLGLLALAVVLTFIAQVSGFGSQSSMLAQLMGAFGLSAQTIGMATVWFLAIVAVLVMAFAVTLLRDTGAPVRLDAAGVHDRRWSPQPISWLNIAQFDPASRFGADLVQVQLKDPQANPPATRLARLALAAGVVPAGTVVIPVTGLDCSAEALCAAILEIGTPFIHAAEDAAEEAAEQAAQKAAAAPQGNS